MSSTKPCFPNNVMEKGVEGPGLLLAEHGIGPPLGSKECSLPEVFPRGQVPTILPTFSDAFLH